MASMLRDRNKLGVGRSMYFMNRFMKKKWDFWLLDLAFN